MCCVVLRFFQDLSSWKSRRQSQRKSEERDEGTTIQQGSEQHQMINTSSQQRATQQLTNEIEDMVLSAFGFTRAVQQQQQQPSAVVRSTDLVRSPGNTQQSPGSRPAPDTTVGLRLRQLQYLCDVIIIIALFCQKNKNRILIFNNTIN